ncbi:hypothetical protein CEXT_378671 [Caerostris extrusa]|uniref:Uncharacterized protein n=1 Tax=Caerostris extrusa TaxID=172846 RepID=A0AAV4XBH0_CAEEX|nr:hypothetical protein CEXT_378671 [Caerostris extrusa]
MSQRGVIKEFSQLFFPNLQYVWTWDSLPDTKTMDVFSAGDDGKPPYRQPPDPPLGSDEFLYLHLETITKIIELKAKLLADWFRPKGLDPESASKLDKEYDATTAEMLELCKGLGNISQRTTK